MIIDDDYLNNHSYQDSIVIQQEVILKIDSNFENILLVVFKECQMENLDFLNNINLDQLIIDNCKINEKNITIHDANISSITIDSTDLESLTFMNCNTIETYVHKSKLNRFDTINTNIKVLNLKNNDLNYLELNIGSLEHLDLSDNILKKIKFHDNMTSLQKIILSNNDLDSYNIILPPLNIVDEIDIENCACNLNNIKNINNNIKKIITSNENELMIESFKERFPHVEILSKNMTEKADYSSDIEDIMMDSLYDDDDDNDMDYYEMYKITKLNDLVSSVNNNKEYTFSEAQKEYINKNYLNNNPKKRTVKMRDDILVI